MDTDAAEHRPPHRSLAEALTDPASFTTTIAIALIDTFGTAPDATDEEAEAWYHWDLEALFAEIERVLGVVPKSPIADRILAAATLLGTDWFYVRLGDFLVLASVLDGDTYDPTSFDPPDVDGLAWAIVEATALAPPEHAPPHFHVDIRRYLGEALDREGYLVTPDALRTAERRTPRGPGPADDPEYAAGIAEVARARADAVSALIRQRLGTLADQLSRLVLRNGDASALIRRLRELAGP